MLITPRTYSASQTPDRTVQPAATLTLPQLCSRPPRQRDPTDASHDAGMIFIRQTGSVRVGEVIRYTLTYKPPDDGIYPPPTSLHVNVKNTSAIPLRAAYLHGPYTLYASCYPSSFEPNTTCDEPDSGNVPQFEPYLKAGGSWNAVIPILRSDRTPNTPLALASDWQGTTWIIEIVSQVVFSSSASVNFEVLVGQNETSSIFPPNGPAKLPKAADLRDHWPSGSQGKQLLATKGVYSDSITLRIDDTASLWNSPHFPSLSDDQSDDNKDLANSEPPLQIPAAASLRQPLTNKPCPKVRQKVHLVVLTHGLHSNLGADMLYLKERIDAASKRTRQSSSGHTMLQSALSNTIPGIPQNSDCREEQVIVRGFPGNAARTERGIQYLGKRLAKYVLLMTYPDQPYLPPRKTKAKTFSGPFSNWRTPHGSDVETKSSSLDAELLSVDEHHAYQVTSISFVGHSLGGLVQTYAIAYIQKHSPGFFDNIRPINFIALATPFLGLSNENPMYVRFALDFGLVGRTGQDLGLGWTAPRIRTGWETLMGGGLGESSKSQSHTDACAKPLLRILPSGPAHEALTKFRHRTIYSNLVNDGIVPLRTSCLLFLDWKGLERVEKARRENGIVGTMAEWGWAELTGANSKSPKATCHIKNEMPMAGSTNHITQSFEQTSLTVSPRRDTTIQLSSPSASSSSSRKLPAVEAQPVANSGANSMDGSLQQLPSSPLAGLFSIFKPKEPVNKHVKILKRSQTLTTPLATDLNQQDGPYNDPAFRNSTFNAPPQTTVFESAGDILMPPLPSIEYIVNPASRARTVLHDRIYHPEDVPRTPMSQEVLATTFNDDEIPVMDSKPQQNTSVRTGLKVEEKIARAYHRGLSWRKVLVRLEPDAHNNIIVRRMFANAYGWPVVQHLVDTHFGPSSLENMDDYYEDHAESPISAVGVPAVDSFEHTGLDRVVLNTRTG
ncbi:putative serine esterase-domain-containing protein [Aspergillus karnatakaensis]|uniref:lipase ROG1 family protein n=1 Tax=Aspergillus karnatakaensis TaxID=1810916 RepID=UPI003CCD5286